MARLVCSAITKLSELPTANKGKTFLTWERVGEQSFRGAARCRKTGGGAPGSRKGKGSKSEHKSSKIKGLWLLCASKGRLMHSKPTKPKAATI